MVGRGSMVMIYRVVERGYVYRRVTALSHAAGWSVNHKHIERIWRRENLKVLRKQPKRRSLWHYDRSCIRLRPEYPDHVLAYDFVEARTHDGCKFRILEQFLSDVNRRGIPKRVEV